MPYVIMKRNDIPDGVLQILDLEPNTSQRNYTLDVPGQTKYVNAAENETVTTLGAGPVTLFRKAKGLAAWFLTRTDDGTGVKATGQFVFSGQASDGDTTTVDTTALGGPSVTFTFRTAPATPTDVLIGITIPNTAANLKLAIKNVLNGLTPYVTAFSTVGFPPVRTILTAIVPSIKGNSIRLSVNGIVLFPIPMAGGRNGNAISDVDANKNALTVLSRYSFGDLTTPAKTLTLIDLNGAIVGSVLTPALHTELLYLLSGAKFSVDAGTQIADVGGFLLVVPPVTLPTGNRNIYRHEGLSLSSEVGTLSLFTASDFVYAGVAGNPNGEAIVIYNDDGNFFTP